MTEDEAQEIVDEREGVRREREREPASILGELIEDEAIRLGGSIGTVTSFRVAEAVLDALRADPALAAAALGGEVEYAVKHDGHVAFGWRGLSRREAESKIADLEDDGATAGAFVPGSRLVGPWREVTS